MSVVILVRCKDKHFYWNGQKKEEKNREITILQNKKGRIIGGKAAVPSTGNEV